MKPDLRERRSAAPGAQAKSPPACGMAANSSGLRTLADLSSIQLSRIASSAEPPRCRERSGNPLPPPPRADAPGPCATYRPRRRGCAPRPRRGTPLPADPTAAPSCGLTATRRTQIWKTGRFSCFCLFFATIHHPHTHPPPTPQTRKISALFCFVACHKITKSRH